MADDSAQDKTEQPTERRLAKAQSKGQVPRSRELDTFIMLLCAGLCFVVLGDHMVATLLDIMRNNFTIPRALVFDPDAQLSSLTQAISDALWMLAPFFGVMVVAAILAPMAIGGVTFSVEPMQFKWENMDPVKGLGRIFAWTGLMEMGKALVKFALVGGVGGYLLWTNMPLYVGLGEMSVKAGIGQLGHELVTAFLLLSGTLVLLAAVDVPFQLWDHQRQLKMSRQDIKDEMKESEGNPEVKGKQRSRQMEIMSRRMMEAVPTADVVVTNPSHYAVALRYDQGRMAAPVVVATGVDLVAGHIRRVAAANDVVIVEAPPLARALYHSTELGDEIPEGLYLAVAQVLAYVFQLKHYQRSGGVAPRAVDDYPIPDSLRRDE